MWSYRSPRLRGQLGLTGLAWAILVYRYGFSTAARSARGRGEGAGFPAGAAGGRRSLAGGADRQGSGAAGVFQNHLPRVPDDASRFWNGFTLRAPGALADLRHLAKRRRGHARVRAASIGVSFPLLLDPEEERLSRPATPTGFPACRRSFWWSAAAPYRRVSRGLEQAGHRIGWASERA